LLSRATPDRKVHILISEANGRGGLDNITAIVVEVSEVGDQSDDAPTGEMEPLTRPS
jgi:serine/threonine protein phosphatase PrpC